MLRDFRLPVLCAALLTLALAGCSSPSDDKKDSSSSTDATAVLTQYADNVVVADYTAFDTAADALATAIGNLVISDAATVTAARTAWLATRVPWERSESWLFGPVDSNGIDPAVDTWPLDITTMTGDLADSGYSTTNDDIKGFHAIEYALWSLTGTPNDTVQNVADDLTATIIANLGIIAGDLAAQTQDLLDAWNTGFRGNFIASGNGGIYVSQSAAMQEIVNGMIGIADEVAAGKIGGPFGDGNLDNVESQYSYNSITDFTNNITGIKIAYLGSYGDSPTQQANSVSAFVAGRNAALDTSIQDLIEDALTAIAGMNVTQFHTAPNTTTGAADAITAIQDLQDALQGQLLPLIQSIDFKY